MKPRVWIFSSLLIAICTSAAAGVDVPQVTLPPGYIVLPWTLSPNHRYGVTAYDDTNNPLPSQDLDDNKLIDIHIGRVIATIHADPAMTRMNHGGILPSRWSSDGSLLLWQVDGKWTKDVIVLLNIKNGEAKGQINVLKIAQTAILKRTRKAAPDKYEEAKEANTGNGSAYPEGFTVEVEVDAPISFPLHVRVELTSNPKEIERIPTLDSHLEGVLDEKGRFRVTRFHLGPASPSHFY